MEITVRDINMNRHSRASYELEIFKPIIMQNIFHHQNLLFVHMNYRLQTVLSMGGRVLIFGNNVNK